MTFNFISSPLFRKCFIGSSSHRTKSYCGWCVSARVKWGNSKQQTSSYLTCVESLPFELGGLKQQKFMLSQHWRLEVQNHGMGRVGSSWWFWGRVCAMPLSMLPTSGGCLCSWHSLACTHLTSVYTSIFTVCVCLLSHLSLTRHLWLYLGPM